MKKLFLFLISLSIFLPGYAFAATHDIHIGWAYDYQEVEGRTLAGYHLYKEGVEVCTSNTPSDRSIDCSINSEDGTFDFTITAFCTDGYESAHSPAYPYTLTTSQTTVSSYNINLAWTYDYQTVEGRTLAGYYLYKEGVKICTTNTPADRSMDCTFDSEEGTFNFTLTAFCTDGYESEHSSPYSYTLTTVIEPILLANFNTIPTSLSGDVPFSITFDASASSGNIASYSWDFGDTSSGSGSQTSHTYQTPGTLNATLTLIGTSGATSQKSVVVTVGPAPVAAITTTPTSLSGDLPFTVSFDGSGSSGTISTYSWNFGDSSSGNGSQVSHTYTTSGQFNTTLTVTSANGTTSQKSVTVTVSPAPVAAITTNPTVLTGTTPFPVSFNATSSTGNINSYEWNFGDNSTGSGSQTSHTYTTASSFTATLTVTSTNGTISRKSVTIVTTAPPPPVAVISPTTLTGDAPLTVSFNGSSSTNAITYAWIFGDGSIASGSQINHTFTTAGTYTTTLTVTNTEGVTNKQSVTVTANEVPAANTPPIAVIGTNSTVGDAPLSVEFDGSGSLDNDGTIHSYLWNYGDGSPAATGVKATHSYTEPGTYSASLTVTDNQGAQDSIVTPVMITGQTATNEAPTAGMTTSTTDGAIPLEVNFDGSTSTDPEDSTLTYSWNFGDGIIEQGIKPNHTYTSPGSFTATLTVTDDCGAVASTSTTITATEAGTPEFMIELGEIEIDNNWMRINFSTPFINPIVVAGPPSYNDESPCVVRLNNISSTGFDIRIQEWSYLDGNHTKETVAYFVMEQGNFTLNDGTMVEAGQFTSNDTNFQTVPFKTLFAIEPVVMTSFATINEEDTVTGRLQNISTTSFEHKTQEQQLANGHGTETVNYIAWEPSQNTIEGINVIVNKTADKVRNRWYTIKYDEQLAELPIFLGTMQSNDGLDPCAVRYTNTTNTELQVKVEEEQSQDDETRHTSETVGYFLFFSNPAN